MLISIDELDIAGQVAKTTIQTDYISSIRQSITDYSDICQICLIGGNRIARHDYEWCKEENKLDEYHERQVGPKDIEVTIISMSNGDIFIAKGQVDIPIGVQ